MTQTECRLCKKIKPIDQFPESPIDPEWRSPFCSNCLCALRRRLEIVGDFDKKICRELGLDYEDVLKNGWEYPKSRGIYG